MKRILIFSTAYLPLVGGAEIAVKEITDRCSYEFVIITAKLRKDLPDHEKIGNVEVYRIGTGSHWDKFRLIWAGHKKAKELGAFNTVWSIMASYAGFAALRYKKRNKQVPFLLTLQEGDSKWDIYKHVWWCWPYFKQIFKKADRIQAISNYLAKWAKSLGAGCPIEVIPNGVNFETFQLSPNTNLRSGKVVITTSRLVTKNGLSDLIKAMKYLDPTVKLRIIGSGGLEESLKKEATVFGERVQFLGEKDHQEISRELKDSDVFCRPSLSEGLGNSFLEAMYVGIPIVGTNVGGIPDFLVNGETGLFCKVGDHKDIAEKINRILNDSKLAEKLRTNGQKLVKEKYSWDMIAEKMKNIL